MNLACNITNVKYNIVVQSQSKLLSGFSCNIVVREEAPRRALCDFALRPQQTHLGDSVQSRAINFVDND